MTDPNSLNDYGAPLHACNGHRFDEHYWSWVGWKHCILSAMVPCTINGCRYHDNVERILKELQ